MNTADQRLFQRSKEGSTGVHGVQTPTKLVDSSSDSERRFATKSQLAKRYGVSPRTITTWLYRGLLSGFKIRHVLRFDVEACDQSLAKHCHPV